MIAKLYGDSPKLLSQMVAVCAGVCALYIYIWFGNLFLAYAPGYAPGSKAYKFQLMLHGPEPSATFAVAPMLLQEKRYAPRYALNLKLPSAAWGSLPLKLGMRWVCAGHIPGHLGPAGTKPGSHWNPSGTQASGLGIYFKPMRHGMRPGQKHPSFNLFLLATSSVCAELMRQGMRQGMR